MQTKTELNKKTTAPLEQEEKNKITKKRKVEQPQVAKEFFDAVDEVIEIEQFFTCIDGKYVPSLFNTHYALEDNSTEIILKLIASILPSNEVWSEKLFNRLKKAKDTQSLINTFLCDEMIHQLAYKSDNAILQIFFKPQVLNDFYELLLCQFKIVCNNIKQLNQDEQLKNSPFMLKILTSLATVYLKPEQLPQNTKQKVEKLYQMHQTLQEINQDIKPVIRAIEQKDQCNKINSTNPFPTFFNNLSTQKVETPYFIHQNLPDNELWLLEQQSQCNGINTTNSLATFFTNQANVNNQNPEQEIICIESDESEIYSYDLG